MTAAVAALWAFSLVQAGQPLDGYGDVASATTSGSGVVRVARPLVYAGVRTQPARVRRGEIVYRLGARRIVLRVRSATLTAFADRSRLLDLELRVTASNDPSCPVGSEGEAYLMDDTAGQDEAKLLICPPVWEHYFNPLRGRIEVTVKPGG